MCPKNCKTTPIRAGFCSSNSLIQDGEFYFPVGRTDGKLYYRKLSAVYDQTQELTTVAVSQKRFVKEQGKFVDA